MLHLLLAGLVLGLGSWQCTEYVRGFTDAYKVVAELSPQDAAALRREAERLRRIAEAYWDGWAAVLALAAEDLTDPIGD